MRVAIIGAGIEGLACARRLRDAGLDATLFNKSRGIGGRLATRRADPGNPEVAFDHGATHFDADLGSNAMNWQYVAGTGVDAPVFSRVMSPLLQSERFAMGDYVRTYVPELAHLSDAEITAAHGQDAGVPAYPAPLIGHEAARARALAVWEALRG